MADTNTPEITVPETWKYKDPLRILTDKFNKAVQAILELQENTEGVSSGTLERIKELQNSLNTELDQIKEDLSKKIDGVTVSDLNLDKVDNTSDMDKPVSTATRQAIDDAVANAIKSEEAGLEIDGVDLYDPEVSHPIKQYIEDRLTELFVAYNNGTYNPEYNIASSDRLGVIKSGEQVQVNQSNGTLEVPSLDTLSSDVAVIQSQVSRIIESLESNNTLTSTLNHDVGNITGLATQTKTSIVAAINELVQKVHDLDT